jgi:hypothetical protein
VTRLTATVLTALDVVLLAVAMGVVLATEDANTIVLGDLLALAGCLLAIPLLHYWIDGDGRHG